MMDEGGVEVDGKSDEAMLKVICETDAGRMNHVIRVIPSDVLSTQAGQLTSSTTNRARPPESAPGANWSSRVTYMPVLPQEGRDSAPLPPPLPSIRPQRSALQASLGRDAHSMAWLLSHPKAMGPLFRYISTTRRLRTTFDDLNTDRQCIRQPTS